jgi:lipid A 3-O-deacylase
MQIARTTLASCGAVALAAWLAAAPAAVAQSLPIDELRFGLFGHSLDPSNDEDGVDLNLEVLFRKFSCACNDAFLEMVLRPRIHLGTSINLAGETSQLYTGFTWDARLTSKLSLELSFGAALHNGPTGDGHQDSYGCALNFRESASLGYELDKRWTVYGTVAHMSNAGLCDHNSGITSAGVRLGYKLN